MKHRIVEVSKGNRTWYIVEEKRLFKWRLLKRINGQSAFSSPECASEWYQSRISPPVSETRRIVTYLSIFVLLISSAGYGQKLVPGSDNFYCETTYYGVPCSLTVLHKDIPPKGIRYPRHDLQDVEPGKPGRPTATYYEAAGYRCVNIDFHTSDHRTEWFNITASTHLVHLLKDSIDRMQARIDSLEKRIKK